MDGTELVEADQLFQGVAHDRGEIFPRRLFLQSPHLLEGHECVVGVLPRARLVLLLPCRALPCCGGSDRLPRMVPVPAGGLHQRIQ